MEVVNDFDYEVVEVVKEFGFVFMWVVIVGIYFVFIVDFVGFILF